MSSTIEDDLRTALRQAGAIASLDGPTSLRQTLTLAHDLYAAMVRLEPDERARRVRLIDAMFGLSPGGPDTGLQ